MEVASQEQGRASGFVGSLVSNGYDGVLGALRLFVRVSNPPLTIAGAFLAVQLTMTLMLNGRFSFRDSSIVMPFSVMLFLIAVDLCKKAFVFVNGGRKSLKESLKGSVIFLRDWIPVVILIYSYENLRNLTHLFIKGDITPSLMKFDQLLFGAHPSLWLQKLSHPFLTDYLAVAYSLYFVFPFVIVVTLYLYRRFDAFFDVVGGMVLCMYIGFVCYVAFPASPPRFAIADQYWLTNLQGVFFGFSQSIYDQAAAASHWCAFPSLHVALSTLALLYSRRYSDLWGGRYRLFWILLPLVVSLWVATVYLRHHWFGDVLAGWILAYCCYRVSLSLTRLWYRPSFSRIR